MKPAQYENTIVRLINNGNKFYTYNRHVIDQGYRLVYIDEDTSNLHDIDLPTFKIDQMYQAKKVEIKEHTSQPPARFNQASLIKALDDAGVGRPSTYKSMANMAIERGYAHLVNRAYVMTDNGNVVIEQLQQYFPNIIDKDFTKQMEEHLDDIATQDED